MNARAVITKSITRTCMGIDNDTPRWQLILADQYGPR